MTDTWAGEVVSTQSRIGSRLDIGNDFDRPGAFESYYGRPREAFVFPIPEIEVVQPRAPTLPVINPLVALVDVVAGALARVSPLALFFNPGDLTDATLRPGQPTVAPEFVPREPELEPELEPLTFPGTDVTVRTPRIGTATPLRDPRDNPFADPFEFYTPAAPGPRSLPIPGFGLPGTEWAQPLPDVFLQPRIPFSQPSPQPSVDPFEETRPPPAPAPPRAPPITAPFFPGLAPASPPDSRENPFLPPVFFAPNLPDVRLTPFDRPEVFSGPSTQPAPNKADKCKCPKEEKAPERFCERGYYVANSDGKIRFTKWEKVKKCQPSKLKFL